MSATKTILLCGGGGYLGSVLADELLQRGYGVKIFDRFFFGRAELDPLCQSLDLELIRGDVRSVESDVFEGVSAVIHLAGLSNDPSCDIDPKITEEINLDGTLRVARLAKEAGVERFVFSSSCSVYGAGDETSSEESPLRPVSLYAKLKVAAEDRLMELSDQDFGVTALRNATIFGLSYRMRFDLAVNLMTLSAFKSRKIYVTGGGRQWRPLVHVRDVSQAFIDVIEADPALVFHQIFNVGSDEQNYQIRRLATVIAEVVPQTTVEIVPDDADKRTYRVSFARISEKLAFQPKWTVQQGSQEILAALKDWRIEDTIRTRTVAFYRHLIEAERLIREVSYEGRVL